MASRCCCLLLPPVYRFGPGHRRTPGQLRQRAAELDDLLRRLLRQTLQRARSNQHGKRAIARSEVGVSTRLHRQDGNFAARSGWRPLRHRSRRPRLCARCAHREAPLDLPASTPERHPSLLRPSEPRSGNSRRQGFSGHTRCARRGPRRENRSGDMGRHGRRLSHRAHLHGRATRGEGPDHPGSIRRRIRHSRIHRRL